MSDDDDFGLAPVDDRPTSGADQLVRQAVAETLEEQQRRHIPVSRVPDWMYPFGLVGLGAWIPMALWAAMAGGMWGMTLVWGQEAGIMALRALLPASVVLSLIASLYGAACCSACIEATANDSEVQEWPAFGDWKEWAYSGLFVMVVFAQLLLAAAALTWWAMPWYVWAPLPLALAALPLGVLAAAEADWWVPYSPVVFRTLPRQTGLWLSFVGKWIGMLAAVLAVTWAGVLAANWWFLTLAAPLLATVILISARLLGRLASKLSIDT